MNITIQDIRASLPKAKRKADPFWVNYVLRPLSTPLAWFFIKIGLKANHVTYLSIIVSVMGGILLLSGNYFVAITGALLFNLFAVLDCVDGNIARATKKFSAYGEWVDALGGYITYTVVLLFSGLAIGNQATLFFEFDYILLASLAVIANLLMRVIYQNFKTIKTENVKKEFSARRSISQNFGITGFMMPFLLLSVIFKNLEFFILFYFVYFIILCIGVILSLIYKVEKSNE